MSTEDHPDWWRPVGGSNAQDSTLERRSLIWNDNGIEDGTLPPNSYTEKTLIGKFFPRGLRGKAGTWQVYARATAGGSMTLWWSPHPGTGPFWYTTITPGLDWAWVDALGGVMWPYDSIFIWVHECDADVSFAYDTEPPYDTHDSITAGSYWNSLDQRLFFRLVYDAETPGDVPVSGTLTTIPLPNTSPKAEIYETEIPAGMTLSLNSYAAGWLLNAMWKVESVAALALIPHVIADEKDMDFGAVDLATYYSDYTALSQADWHWGQWDAVEHKYALFLNTRIPFYRTFTISLHNPTAAPLTGAIWLLVDTLR
ncbi:hypothetical protein ES707_18164 [subsurface metagenome]